MGKVARVRIAIALSALACLLAQPALAKAKGKAKPRVLSVQPLPADFDLTRLSSENSVDAEVALPSDPRVPRGVDPRFKAWTPPSYELALGEGGPVLAVGAMGTRRKGMPKLAHVGIDWDF